MSAIQEALKKAQRERESQGGGPGPRLGLFSTTQRDVHPRKGRVGFFGLLMGLVALACLLIFSTFGTAPRRAGPPDRVVRVMPEPRVVKVSPRPQKPSSGSPAGRSRSVSGAGGGAVRSNDLKTTPDIRRAPARSVSRQGPSKRIPSSSSAENRVAGTVPKRPATSGSRLGGLPEAKRLSERGDLVGAERILKGMIDRGPERIEAMINLGNLYLRDFGDPKRALALYRRALSLDPDRASIHINLGAYYLKTRDLAKAGEHIRRALQLDSGLAEAHYNLACLYALEGDREKAERALQRAQAIDPRCARWAREDPDLEALRSPAKAGG